MALLVPAAIGALVIAYLSFRNLGLGVALLPFVAAVVPLSVGTGTQSPIVAGLMLAVLLLVLWAVRSLVTRDLTIARTAATMPALAVMLIWVVAFFYSDADHSAFVWNWDDFLRPRLGGLAVALISLGIFLLAMKVGRDTRWIKFATWSYLAVGLVAILGFFLHINLITKEISTLGLFTLWTCALAYGQALYNKELPGWLRVALLVFVAAWLYKATILQTIWFSGWVPSLVAVAVITLFRSRRAFLILAALVAVAVLLNWPHVHAALWDAKVSEGDLTRVPIWAQAWDLLSRHPLLGTGPVGYAAYYMTLYNSSPYSMSTHSNYLDILAETGFLGAATYLWMLVAMLVSVARACRTWCSGFFGGYAIGALGGFFGMLVAMQLGDWVIPFVYNQTIAGFRYTVHTWVFLGFLAGLSTLRPGNDGEPAEPANPALEPARLPLSQRLGPSISSLPRD